MLEARTDDTNTNTSNNGNWDSAAAAAESLALRPVLLNNLAVVHSSQGKHQRATACLSQARDALMPAASSSPASAASRTWWSWVSSR